MIVYPEYIGLKDWAASLFIDYPKEFLPQLVDEDHWQDWGACLISTGVFSRAGLPSPFDYKNGPRKDNFSSWQEWARTVYMILEQDQVTTNATI